MSLGIRGFNPVWSFVDLSGKQFDDTYYMYVLENTIPYIPVKVYHDPDLDRAWTNPIRFLANGTLPTDVFFVPGVYRLEFRQNDGINTPTQQDALIYPVEDYIPGSGGSTPVDTVAFTSSNQITNPQFVLVSHPSPFVWNSGNVSIGIGPGWNLDLTGNGSATINQVSLNNSNTNPSNAPYALRLTLNGWDADGVKLRQRFFQNGMLWANKIVSSAITARVQSGAADISASLIDSNGSPLAEILPSTSVNSEFNEYTGYGQLGGTSNPDSPPSAYIDYILSLPNTSDIYLTSIQVVVQDLPVQPSFEQDSVNRQIDHTYNSAYPIIPVGGMIFYGGTDLPEHYLLCDGTAISRIAFPLLFAKIGTIWGAGDGSATFNIPDFRDKVPAGSGGSLFGGTVGTSGGDSINALGISNMPAHDHPGSSILKATGAGAVVTAVTTSSVNNTSSDTTLVTIASQGSGASFSIVQKTAIAGMIIRFE